MKNPLVLTPIILAITLVATNLSAAPSLSWWLIPENADDLPLEVTPDNTGSWDEIWLRSALKIKNPPHQVMENSLGVRWMGSDPEATGKPSRAILVFDGRLIVEVSGDKTRTGKIDGAGDKISWSDQTQTPILANRKRRGSRKRSRGSHKIHFGKIALPPLGSKSKELRAGVFSGLEEFLNQSMQLDRAPFDSSSYGLVFKMAENSESIFGFRYGSSCKDDDKSAIESILTENLDRRLTCWVSQNPERSPAFFAALMQRPIFDCRLNDKKQDCGQSTLPLADGFFVRGPKLSVDMNGCDDDLSGTILHEVLHLAGVADGDPMDQAVVQAYSCEQAPASIEFDGAGEEFFNDLQVETRLLLFKKVREESVEKWGWTEAEKSYVLGSICEKMSDKFCSRRYFQIATESNPTGNIQLPEGGDVTFTAAAHFKLYDSVTEELARMHELMKYLSRDPNGTLLRRLENGNHRLHEFFLARSALEQVKNNKGVCGSDVEDRINCEDLAQIVKYPWFKNP